MKKVVYILTISIACTMLIGCGDKDSVSESGTATAIEQNIDTNDGDAEEDDNIEIDINNNNEEDIPFDKMQEIVDEIGLDNAVAYGEKIQNVLSNQIILLCESPSGRYKAYGFISPEYGMNGILIDNIIDQQSNHNFFSQKWVYSETFPTLDESDDFYQVILTICQNQEEGMKEILFDAYDTGTMDADGWDKM